MAASLITPISLGQAALTTSYATFYTVPVGLKTFLKDFDIVNTTGSSIGIYVSIVPVGGTAGASNAIFYNNSLPAYTTVQWCGSQVLIEGVTIQVKASAVGCTMTATGGEVVV